LEEKGKAISAQPNLTRACPSLTTGPHLSAPFPSPAHPLPPPLWPVGPSYRRQSPSRALCSLSTQRDPPVSVDRPCPSHRSSILEPSLKVTNLPMPLISHSLSCACAIVRRSKSAPPLSHSAADHNPLVPLRWCRAHGRIRRVTPNLPGTFPAPQDPRRGHALASSETPPRSQAAAPLAT
jgi:hypothetical protein